MLFYGVALYIIYIDTIIWFIMYNCIYSIFFLPLLDSDA
nr:MAG TPA: hypothetical protein [Caudoviricetes sp.]